MPARRDGSLPIDSARGASRLTVVFPCLDILTIIPSSPFPPGSLASRAQADQVLARLDPVLAAKPSLVTVIVGSNDRLSATSKCSACAYGQCFHPRELEAFRADMDAMIDALLQNTPAVIAVFSIPPVEAAPGSRIHECTAIVNEHLQEICLQRASPRLVYVPFGEALLPYSVKTQDGGLFDETNPPGRLWTPNTFVSFTLKTQFLRWVCCRSYEDISQQFNLKTSCDCLHFNAHAGTILLDAATAFVAKYATVAEGSARLPEVLPVIAALERKATSASAAASAAASASHSSAVRVALNDVTLPFAMTGPPPACPLSQSGATFPKLPGGPSSRSASASNASSSAAAAAAAGSAWAGGRRAAPGPSQHSGVEMSPIQVGFAGPQGEPAEAKVPAVGPEAAGDVGVGVPADTRAERDSADAAAAAARVAGAAADRPSYGSLGDDDDQRPVRRSSRSNGKPADRSA